MPEVYSVLFCFSSFICGSLFNRSPERGENLYWGGGAHPCNIPSKPAAHFCAPGDVGGTDHMVPGIDPGLLQAEPVQ